MSIQLSVILCTYNPTIRNLTAVLKSLQKQTLPFICWELLIINNNSTNSTLMNIDLLWHTNCKIINEYKQGLTHSRICGIFNATAEIIIFLDDDNLLDENYLELTLSHFRANQTLGSIGGVIRGVFENYTPKAWTKQFWEMLAIRDFGDKTRISAPFLTNSYPGFAPVGAGMAVRKTLLNKYLEDYNAGHFMLQDRTQSVLSSGGDNEINIQILKAGHSVAYFSNLKLSHLIPNTRFSINYLSKLNYQSSKSWTILLRKYDICPWKPINKETIILRKIKSFLTTAAWRSAQDYIKWRGGCGIFDGLSKSYTFTDLKM